MNNQLLEDLTDVLLAHGVTPTREMLDGILFAIGASAITAQQFAVLRAAISGQTDKEICDTLGLHRRTLEEHWREIRARLGIASRFQLGAFVVGATCGNPQYPAEATRSKIHSTGKNARH